MALYAFYIFERVWDAEECINYGAGMVMEYLLVDWGRFIKYNLEIGMFGLGVNYYNNNVLFILLTDVKRKKQKLLIVEINKRFLIYVYIKYYVSTQQ